MTAQLQLVLLAAATGGAIVLSIALCWRCRGDRPEDGRVVPGRRRRRSAP